MSEEEKDLKKGEKETPADTGQSDEETDEELEESEEESKDDSVKISKSELDKIQKDRDNYRQGLLSIKRKGRTLPESEPAKKKEEEEEDELTQEFVTKKDYQKQIEKSAIKEASKDPETDENWESIMEYYVSRHGKETVEDILADIEVAKKTWKAQQPPKTLVQDDTKKVESELASDTGLSKGKDKSPKPEKKSILPKKEKMEDWYGGQK